jgi:hypothetical protein
MIMPYGSNAAEVWYPEPEPSGSSSELRIDLLPPASLTQPLWRSLLANVRDTFAPEKLPPLQLTSRPVDVGLPLGDRLRLPWFRTVFTNIGDVISPETLPPLELESFPVDVGELITDQLSHFWFSSLLRNLADRLVPENLPGLELTSKPVANIIPETWILLPAWSEVISTPKVFYPDKPNTARPVAPLPARNAGALPELAPVRPKDPTEAGLLRDLRRSRIRRGIWIGMAAAQAIYLVVIVIWPH